MNKDWNDKVRINQKQKQILLHTLYVAWRIGIFNKNYKIRIFDLKYANHNKYVVESTKNSNQEIIFNTNQKRNICIRNMIKTCFLTDKCIFSPKF